MKPDKKYMPYTNDDLIFDTFEIETPFSKLNYGLTPIINIENDYFRSSEDIEIEDLRAKTINKALGGDEELYCYNKTSYMNLSNNFEVPTPTDILRNFDMDLNEEDLIAASSRKPNDDDNLNFNFDNKNFNNKNFNMPGYCSGEYVFDQIRRFNPMILNTLDSYRIPYPIARTLIIRIANLSNKYCYRE